MSWCFILCSSHCKSIVFLWSSWSISCVKLYLQLWLERDETEVFAVRQLSGQNENICSTSFFWTAKFHSQLRDLDLQLMIVVTSTLQRLYEPISTEMWARVWLFNIEVWERTRSSCRYHWQDDQLTDSQRYHTGVAAKAARKCIQECLPASDRWSNCYHEI